MHMQMDHDDYVAQMNRNLLLLTEVQVEEPATLEQEMQFMHDWLRLSMHPDSEHARMLGFARRHDWGYDALLVQDGIRVGEDVRYPGNGQLVREYSTIRNMAQLRRWAGY